MDAIAPTKPAYSQGFALCRPTGILVASSFRATPEAAIATMFTDPTFREDFWQRAQAHGWTVRFVFTQVWVPQFYVTNPEAAA